MCLSERINDTNCAPWVIEEIRKLETERNVLRSALKHIVNCWDGPLYRHEMLPLIEKARAALWE